MNEYGNQSCLPILCKKPQELCRAIRRTFLSKCYQSSKMLGTFRTKVSCPETFCTRIFSFKRCVCGDQYTTMRIAGLLCSPQLLGNASSLCFFSCPTLWYGHSFPLPVSKMAAHKAIHERDVWKLFMLLELPWSKSFIYRQNISWDFTSILWPTWASFLRTISCSRMVSTYWMLELFPLESFFTPFASRRFFRQSLPLRFTFAKFMRKYYKYYYCPVVSLFVPFKKDPNQFHFPLFDAIEHFQPCRMHLTRLYRTPSSACCHLLGSCATWRETDTSMPFGVLQRWFCWPAPTSNGDFGGLFLFVMYQCEPLRCHLADILLVLS